MPFFFFFGLSSLTAIGYFFRRFFKNLSNIDLQLTSPCAAVAQPDQAAQRAAFEETHQQALAAGINIVEVEPNQPKLIEQVISPTDIDWNLHEQLKPRLWGHPDETSPQLSEEDFHDIMRKGSGSLKVYDPKRNTRYILDLKEAASYILTCPQWFNTLNQPMMLCIWVRTREDAASFQDFLNMIDWNYLSYLAPRWIIFVENCDNLPKNTLRWKEPSTLWKGHPVIRFMSDIDFKDSKGNLPTEIGFRHFPPMWSYPPAVVNSSTKNISFGMDVPHLCENPRTDKDALSVQCPSVCEVLQSFDSDAGYGDNCFENHFTIFRCPRRFARKNILPQHLFFYGHAYDTPTKYSDTFSQYHAIPMLAHECVLSVIIQTSSKNSKYPYCSNADAPSIVVSGTMISLTPY